MALAVPLLMAWPRPLMIALTVHLLMAWPWPWPRLRRWLGRAFDDSLGRDFVDGLAVALAVPLMIALAKTLSKARPRPWPGINKSNAKAKQSKNGQAKKTSKAMTKTNTNT